MVDPTDPINNQDGIEEIYFGGLRPEVTVSAYRNPDGTLKTEPIKETSFGDWWEDFEKSDAGKFVDAKGLRKEKDFFLGLLGYGDTAEEGRKFALDAASMVNPIPDFINAADHAQQGKYSDAGLYAGFGLLPGAAGPIVNKVKPYLNKLKSFFKSSKIPKNFKSEIDWGKWNKEIPDNKELIEEYNTIEALSKKEGNWMKNPDGTEFTGTPEQFIQQQSKNFRAAFGEIDPYYAYRGTQHHFPELKQKIFSSLDKTQAEGYAHKIKNPTTIKSPEHGTSGGIHELYVKNSDNAGDFDNLIGQYWDSLDLNRDLDRYLNNNIAFNEKRIITLEKQLKEELDPFKAKMIKEVLENTRQNIINFKNYAKNNLKTSPEKEQINNLLRQEFKGEKPMTDDVLEKAIKLDLDNVLLRNIDDEGVGSVLLVNNRLGNFIKSTYGNNGMFDMTNPNIYKEDGGEVTDPNKPLAYQNGPISKEEAQQEFERRKKAEDIYNLIIPSGYLSLDNYFNALRIGNDTDIAPRTTFVDPRSEEAFKQYLGINIDPKYFSLSPNKPSIAKNPDAVYYKLDPKLERQILKFAKTQDIPLDEMVEFNETDLPWDWANMHESGYNEYSALGTFQIGRGIDPETGEEYYSYYDKYDFPEYIQSGLYMPSFQKFGTDQKTKFVEGLEGTPFEIYNRLPVNPKRTFEEEEYQRALEEDIRQQELEFQEGGEVTDPEVADPEDPFANALQSRQPYRDDYMNKLLKYAEPGDDTYMRIEDAFADKFNTELTPIEKIHYKLWLAAGFGNPRDIGVYDIQGYWKSGHWKNNSDPDNHGSDTFKKPNHPTFSAESKYSKQKGGSEYIGGVWREDGGFMAGPHNFYDNDALMWEFSREPNRPEYLYMGLPAVTVDGNNESATQKNVSSFDEGGEVTDKNDPEKTKKKKAVILAETPLKYPSIYDIDETLPEEMQNIQKEYELAYESYEKASEDFDKYRTIFRNYLKGYLGEDFDEDDSYHPHNKYDNIPDEVLNSSAYLDYKTAYDRRLAYGQRRNDLHEEFRKGTEDFRIKNTTFLEEADRMKSWYEKNNQPYEIYPVYNDTNEIKEILSQEDIGDLVLMGHSGSTIAGIPVKDWNRYLQDSDYEQCILGSCFGNKIIDRGLNDVRNMSHTTDTPWVGVNPRAETKEGFYFPNTNHVYNP